MRKVDKEWIRDLEMGEVEVREREVHKKRKRGEEAKRGGEGGK